MEKVKIRCSSLTSYTDCALRTAASSFKWLFEDAGYKLNQRGAGIGATVGTSAHAGVEFSLREKLRTGSPAKISDCIDAGIAEFESIKSTEELEFDATTASQDDAKRQISEIQKAHHSLLLPEIKPRLIEERMFADLGDGFVLSGQADVITMDYTCRDLKTGLEKNYMAQVGAYSILSRSNAEPVEKVMLDYVSRAKKGKPVNPFTVELDRKTCEKSAIIVINRLKSDYKRFLKSGNPVAFQANPCSMLCSDKFCPAYGTKLCQFTYKKPMKRSYL